MIKPLINLNGWETVKAYSLRKGFTSQYVYELIKKERLHYITVVEINNVILVKEK